MSIDLNKISDKFRESQNTRTAVILCVMVFLFVFFLTSKMWINTENNPELCTAIPSEKVAFGDKKTATLKRWEYSADEGIMEIEIDVENTEVSTLNELAYSCFSREGQYFEVSEIVSDDLMHVLKVTGVPREFSDVCLEVSLVPAKNDTTKYSTAQFFTNILQVERVNYFVPRTLIDYYIIRTENKISDLEEEIAGISENLQAKQDLKQEITNNISTLNAKLAYQSENEKQDTKKEIQELQATLKSTEDVISKIMLELDEKNALLQDEKNNLASLKNKKEAEEMAAKNEKAGIEGQSVDEYIEKTREDTDIKNLKNAKAAAIELYFSGRDMNYAVFTETDSVCYYDPSRGELVLDPPFTGCGQGTSINGGCEEYTPVEGGVTYDTSMDVSNKVIKVYINANGIRDICFETVPT